MGIGVSETDVLHGFYMQGVAFEASYRQYGLGREDKYLALFLQSAYLLEAFLVVLAPHFERCLQVFLFRVEHLTGQV